MVEKEIIGISKEDLSNLWKSNPLYNMDYSHFNIATISNQESLIESLKDIVDSQEFNNNIGNFIKSISGINEHNERHFYQWLGKFLIPLTLMNPQSEHYSNLYNSFWESSKASCYTSDNESDNKSRFIMFIFTYSYISNLLFKSVVTTDYNKMKEVFSDYSENNTAFLIFHSLLKTINIDLFNLYNLQCDTEKNKLNEIYHKNEIITYLRISPEYDLEDDVNEKIYNSKSKLLSSKLDNIGSYLNEKSCEKMSVRKKDLINFGISNVSNLDKILDIEKMSLEIPDIINITQIIIDSTVEMVLAIEIEIFKLLNDNIQKKEPQFPDRIHSKSKVSKRMTPLFNA